MGVKFDAVKDDNIKVENFFADDMGKLMESINDFLSHEMLDWDEETKVDKGWRIVPLGITHSTEVEPYSGAFGMIETRITYHAVLLYKKVDDRE